MISSKLQKFTIPPALGRVRLEALEDFS